ncbi:P27 family phage terminase small subunit [Listeria monocytogenes]|uniref:Terminase n=1 Tax=Listeria monocytogenes TaxID=1639 RepID=A0A6C8N1L1_LISMN|nr:P27 family phage terminase small subunit [Listeria monocytogenes]KAA9534125.1 terminase [Listeria monocytogenes]KAA9541450.1 terminase [Listeria monocytogenes]
MNQKKLRKQLMDQIDENDEIEKEKVERYMSLVKMFYQLDKEIDRGLMIETINGKQKFIKPNPAIAEKNKLNASLIALGKDLNLDEPKKVLTNEDSYSKSDLV